MFKHPLPVYYFNYLQTQWAFDYLHFIMMYVGEYPGVG